MNSISSTMHDQGGGGERKNTERCEKYIYKEKIIFFLNAVIFKLFSCKLVKWYCNFAYPKYPMLTRV